MPTPHVIAVVAAGGTGVLQPLTEQHTAAGQRQPVTDLAAAIRAHPTATRWVLADVATTYPPLLAAGATLGRAHDVSLAEQTRLGYAGRWGEPTHLGAIWARQHDRPIPDQQRTTHIQPVLFEQTEPDPYDPVDVLLDAYAAQRQAPQSTPAFEPTPVTTRHLDLLVAADSANALAAAEMSRTGLPWRADVHDRILTEALGPRPPGQHRPAALHRLAETIAAELHSPGLNPDSAAELIAAFHRAGLSLTSTRAWELRRLDHPAVAPLLEYKSLARLHTANGWAWCDTWVRDGRFRPEYVAAAVVSGRWATRGGGALQIPKAVRAAVVADPGHRLVVADARQLEPRVLAALAADPHLTAAAAAGDLYAALAEQSFGGDRDAAKVGLLSAMYGGITPALGTLRRRYPAALALLETAAQAGERGELVRSVLGRTCPRPQPGWDAGPEQTARLKARDRGRFTRNFVIQASAADWAAVLLALLRTTLPAAAELVFFQHDEVVIHCPESHSPAVVAAIEEAAGRATALVLGATPVRLPLHTAVVTSYADAK